MNDSRGGSGIDGAKAALRAAIRARLRAIEAADRSAWSTSLVARAVELRELARATDLLLFRALPTEVDTEPLFAAAVARGVRVHAPVIDGPRLVFRAVDAGTRWTTGPFGILEPASGDELGAEREGERLAILVPGIAFDARGGRLGRGGGHYDRALALPRLRAASRIALAFEAQLVEAVPRQAHDLGVDVIVTERRVLRTGAAGDRRS